MVWEWNGISFHLYGLIIGIALVVTWILFESKARKYHLIFPGIEIVAGVAITAGLMGARWWHVVTDWPYYYSSSQPPWWLMWQVWQGGLSIFGAVAGGMVGLIGGRWLVEKWRRQSVPPVAMIADVLVFGLPFGQAIGRLGNYINQELYGLPTDLAWAIRIDPAHRLSRYQDFETYHPLFAYEGALLLIFGGTLWLWEKWRGPAGRWSKVGTGQIAVWYLWYYTLMRFWLDFLRLDKAVLITVPPFNTSLGINQALSLAVVMGASLWLYNQKKHIRA